MTLFLFVLLENMVSGLFENFTSSRQNENWKKHIERHYDVYEDKKIYALHMKEITNEYYLLIGTFVV